MQPSVRIATRQRLATVPGAGFTIGPSAAGCWHSDTGGVGNRSVVGVDVRQQQDALRIVR